MFHLPNIATVAATMIHKLHHNLRDPAHSVNIVSSLVGNSLLSNVKMVEAGYMAIYDDRRSTSMIPQPPKLRYRQMQSSKGGNAHGPNCGVSPSLTMSAMKIRSSSSLIICTSITVSTCSTMWNLPPPHGSTSTPSCCTPSAGNTTTMCMNYPALSQQSDTYMRQRYSRWKRRGSRQSDGAITTLGP
jgi:hypothetical protein